MGKVVRVPINLTEEEVSRLDAIARHLRLALEPQHAANSGHKYNRKAAIVFLIDNYFPRVKEEE